MAECKLSKHKKIAKKLLIIMFVYSGIPQFYAMAQTLPNLTEALTTYQYTNTNNVQTIRTTLASYQGAAALLGDTVRQQTQQRDIFTGNSLSKRIGNMPQVTTGYDGLGRTVMINYGIDTKTQQPIQTRYHYQLRAGDSSLTIGYPHNPLDTQYPNGYRKKIQLDALGREQAEFDNVIDDDNSSPTCQHLLKRKNYNDIGELQAITNVQGNITRRVYDAEQRLTQQMQFSSRDGLHADIILTDNYRRYDDVQHTLTRYTKNANGSKQTAAITQTFNDANQPMTGKLQHQLLAQTNYDNFAEKHSEMKAQVNSQYHYTALGQLASTTQLWGKQAQTVKFSYGLTGKLLSKTINPKKQALAIQRYQLVYSGDGKLLQQTQAGDGSTQVTIYNNAGKKIAMKDFYGRRFTYAYASILGEEQRVSTQIPSQDELSGYTIHKDYNPFTGRLSRIYYSDKTHTNYDEIKYRYTPDGLVKQKIFPDNKVIAQHYQAQTRQLSQRVDVAGQRSDYHYEDSANRLTRISQVLDAAGTIANVDYHYDGFNQLASIEHKLQKNNNAQRIDSVLLTHDNKGNVVTITHQQQGLTDTQHYAYYANGNLSDKWVNYNDPTSDAVYYYHENYQYVAGHIGKVRHEDYRNDVINAVTTTNYEYDDNSNLRSKKVSRDLPNHLEKSVSLMSYEHNDLDQISKINGHSVTYKNGNLSMGANGAQYTYGAQNQLLSYQAATQRDKTLAAKFTYYPDGSRQSFHYYDAQKKQHSITFYNLNGQVINEQDENKNTASYLMRGKQREARMIQMGHKQQVKFYTHDRHQSISSTLTITGENISNGHADYGVYGQRRNADTTKTAATIDYDGFAYNGEYVDPKPVGGLSYLRARYYQPASASFLQRDSVLFMNEYTYVMGEPLMRSDPSGHVGIALGFFSQGDIMMNPEMVLLFGVIDTIEPEALPLLERGETAARREELTSARQVMTGQEVAERPAIEERREGMEMVVRREWNTLSAEEARAVNPIEAEHQEIIRAGEQRIRQQAEILHRNNVAISPVDFEQYVNPFSWQTNTKLLKFGDRVKMADTDLELFNREKINSIYQSVFSQASPAQ